MQDRVRCLMIIIVDNVTAKNKETAKGIQWVFEELLRFDQTCYNFIMKTANYVTAPVNLAICSLIVFRVTLKMIIEHLNKITVQGRWLLMIYKNLNTGAVDDCSDRLSTALEKFNVYFRIHDVHGFASFLTTSVTPFSTRNFISVYRSSRNRLHKCPVKLMICAKMRRI